MVFLSCRNRQINGRNGTKWSPIRLVIIRKIKKNRTTALRESDSIIARVWRYSPRAGAYYWCCGTRISPPAGRFETSKGEDLQGFGTNMSTRPLVGPFTGSHCLVFIFSCGRRITLAEAQIIRACS